MLQGIRRFKDISPEQLNLWEEVKGLIAWATITPFHFQGNLLASEFLTYNAGKLYVVFSFVAGGVTAAGLAPSFVRTVNELDVPNGYYSNNAIADTQAAGIRYYSNNLELKNFWFSRIEYSGYTNAIISGVRLDV